MRIFIILILSFTALSVFSQCNRERDSLALVALYDHTNGEEWTTTWDLSQSIDSWYGIQLTSEGCVGCIDLDGNPDCTSLGLNPGNNLIGSLPSEIGNLTNLIELHLSYNLLTDSLPPSIGNLENLEVLSINNNLLSGAIPDEIGNLSKLKNLSLLGNSITGTIPAELTLLSNLTDLILSGNDISGMIPDNIGNLTELKNFYFQNCDLEGEIPISFWDLVNLEFVFIDNNRLTGELPPSIGQLKSLESFWANQNCLSGPLPSEIGDLSSIKTLFLGFNKLSDTIPQSIQNLENLERLGLQNNMLTGRLLESLNYEQLTHFKVDRNNLDGCVPRGLLSLCGNNNFSINSNPGLPWQGDEERFCSSDVPQFGAPCDDSNPLTEFDKINGDCNCEGVTCNIRSDSIALVSMYNSLKGEAWKDPWNLNTPMSTWSGIELHTSGCVKAVNLVDRDLDGSLPDGFFELSVVEKIVISENIALVGAIPPSVGNVMTVTELDLSSNTLSSSIPPDLDDLCELKSLNLCCNDLDGMLLAGFALLENLENLDVSNNNLDGQFPSEFIVFCELDTVSFEGTDLPNWEAFCTDGIGAETCDFAMGDLWCLEPLQEMADSLRCMDLWNDSLTIEHIEAGTVIISDKDYAYLHIEGESSSGVVLEETYFYGCAGINFELCSVDSDTIVCDRSVLNEGGYEELDFEPLWECGMDFPICISRTEYLSINQDIFIYPNPVTNMLNVKYQDSDLFYEVIDIYGIILLDGHIKQGYNSINITNLPKGIYFLRNTANLKSERFVKW